MISDSSNRVAEIGTRLTCHIYVEQSLHSQHIIYPEALSCASLCFLIVTNVWIPSEGSAIAAELFGVNSNLGPERGHDL